MLEGLQRNPRAFSRNPWYLMRTREFALMLEHSSEIPRHEAKLTLPFRSIPRRCKLSLVVEMTVTGVKNYPMVDEERYSKSLI
jgi:hypothetical protein